MSKTPFYGLMLEFEPGVVFRPRPSSEQLVSRALRFLGRHPARVADVGTGSGAIAVALAVNAPAVTVYASDTNPAAVEMARANAVAHGVSHRVAVAPGQLLEGLPGELDLVIANLPYLSSAEEYPDEPADAVASGGDGLDLIRALLATAPAHLVSDGRVLLQYRGHVHEGERAELADLLSRLERDGSSASSGG